MILQYDLVSKMRSLALLFVYLSTLYLARGDASEAVPNIPTVEGNVTDDNVTETQHATCKITTDALVAHARATVTRVLTGACNAKTIDERFENLEKNLTDELEEIKSLLYAILENRRDNVLRPLRTDAPIATTNQRARPPNYRRNNQDNVSPRNEEIKAFNSTVQQISKTNGSKTFVYYWQIKDFDEKLASWSAGRSERSPSFHVGEGGYAMYMKVTPRYFPDGTVFIGVGLTHGRYDSRLEWPFSHKIRLEVLDVSTEREQQNRRSRIWDPSTLCSEYFWGRPKSTLEADNPECVGLSVPRHVLLSRSQLDHQSRNTRYLWNGSLIIKLTVFLQNSLIGVGSG